MKKENISITVAIIALVMGISAICIAAYRTPVLSFDYQGVLVGVLSFLVTLLLGWNIYSLIDVGKIKDELMETKAVSSFNAERNNTITCHAVGDFFYRELLGEKPLGDAYHFLYYRVSEIFHASNIGDFKTCEIIIVSLCEIFEEPENVNIKEKLKANIWELITRINQKEHINNYNELVSLVARIGLNYNHSTHTHL